MADIATLFEEALATWAAARKGVIAEFENIPESDYDYRPAAEARSIAELARHIAAAGLVFSGELAREDADFSRRPIHALYQEYAGHLSATASKSELLAMLQDTWTETERKLRAAGPGGMLEQIRGVGGETMTRLSVVHLGISHENYHRGQVAVHARSLGLVPALTRMFQTA
ncbi:MAG TPA: DinB family protein [Longimicrobiales bacterium]|nr:DinB family protein [Longimicrobiales bacterium]